MISLHFKYFLTKLDQVNVLLEVASPVATGIQTVTNRLLKLYLLSCLEHLN
jgi:hypothetical protein